MATLSERLGGPDAITAVVDAFVARAAGDDRINSKFGRTNIPHLKKNFADQVCEATGGPCAYTGRSMREAHDAMRVTAGEFDAFIQDLRGRSMSSTSPRPSTESCSVCCCRCAMRSSRSSRRRRGPRFLTATRPRRELSGAAHEEADDVVGAAGLNELRPGTAHRRAVSGWASRGRGRSGQLRSRPASTAASLISGCLVAVSSVTCRFLKAVRVVVVPRAQLV
jgi:truncated hemoglobin YjbI